MKPEIPPDVTAHLDSVEALSQWERAELGRMLRRSGWTYTEIAEVIPAARSTIAGWCREIRLSAEQVEAIGRRTGSQRGVPRDTQWRRREQRGAIFNRAQDEARAKSADAAWSTGVVLYWGEGFKTENSLGLANSDDDLVQIFMGWTRQYHDPEARFRAKLNLHSGNDEAAAIDFWSVSLGLSPSSFNKTFIKPEGTGHRRNHLKHGVIQVRVLRSTDHYVRTMGWIEGLRAVWRSVSPPD